jgi:ABC-type glycerol-3-phosphate transport system substrate-binding protein
MSVTTAGGVEPVTLTAWTESIATPVMREWIADFQEEYPWISIEFQGLDNETWEETLRTAMYSGSPPDILIIESRAELVEYVNAHLLSDLTAWYNAPETRFLKGYELYSTIRGRRYAIPWDMLVLDLIWYNPRILEKHHLDPATIATWEDLRMCAPSLKRPERRRLRLEVAEPAGPVDIGSCFCCKRIFLMRTS